MRKGRKGRSKKKRKKGTKMREISERITELCAERIRVKNAESAAILGYCVSLAMGAV